MVEHRTGPPRVIAWIGWGALAAVGYTIGVPLLLGGAALFPIAIVACEGGLGEAAVAAAAAVLGVALMGGQLSLPAIGLFAAGALLGTGLRQERALPWLLGMAALSVAALVGLIALPSTFGGSAVHFSPQTIAQAFGMTLHQARQVIAQAQAIIPAFMPLYAGGVALEAFYLARWVLRTRGRELQPVQPFAFWQAPTWLAPLFLAVLGLQTVISLDHASAVTQRLLGYAVIWTEIPLEIFGLAVASFLIARMRVPTFLRVVILVLMFVTPPFSLIPVWVGVLDNMTDLRRIRDAST
ncbi:MAG: DUF2232 domain-containing protein [Thermaerobacter sp.]|nr:DUF2232 domain-containing protein [Thermaerobacter sp.]